MEEQGMINCPNCNKRTFANNDKCIYCKYILKNEEHKFNKEIYNYLNDKYNESKNKPHTIKIAMEKFGLNLEEAKEIIDYISDQIYYKEEAKKNAVIQKKRNEPMEELPTNGIDYSKYKSYSEQVYTARKKWGPLKLTMCTILIILLIILCIAEAGSLNIRIIGIIFSIVLFIKTFSNYEVPLNEHTFVVSVFPFFIHYIIPKLIVIIPLIGILTIVTIYTGLYINNIVMGVIILGIVLTIAVWLKLAKLGLYAEKFTVDENIIRCIITTRTTRTSIDSNDIPSNALRDEYYDILYIKEVKETLNSIIIYGDILKTKVQYYDTIRLC